MHKPWQPVLSWVRAVGLLALSLLWPAAAEASRVVVKDGRVLEGRLAPVAGTIEDPRQAVPDGVANNRPVVMVDDGLRRSFLPERQIQEINEGDSGEPLERFRIPQRVATTGSRVAAAGAISRMTPFDEYGRRIVEMVTYEGNVSIIQGITEITPVWTKVEGLEVQGKNYIWDMRIATSSLPRETLARILHRVVDQNYIEQRLKVVRLYLQSDRYGDAESELKQVLEDFPEEKPEFAATIVRLRQAHARRMLTEVRVRQAAGQHVLAASLLSQFPTDNVAGETLQAVRQMLLEHEQKFARGKRLIERLDELIGKLGTSDQQKLKPIRDELVAELNLNTLDRLAAFEQLADADNLTGEEKVALAISGWLVGANQATRNFPMALSLFEVRNLVRRYLAEPLKVNRLPLLDEMRTHEGAAPAMVAQLLAHMRPPLGDDLTGSAVQGMYRLEVDTSVGEAPISYWVQLPPEYDPLRRYPAIVSLHGVNSTPEQQIDWWAGTADNQGRRLGHAGRNGYIVVAPAWTREHQGTYNYSAAEHTAVLNSLRDACRRFSLDTDRVFLSGHSIGGDAAWDIGVAHPDLWAGIIPIAAVADKFVSHYRDHAGLVPVYLVTGQLDGGKTRQNATYVDYYLRRNFNTFVVEYMGRGHEHFSDEIINLFDWMNRYRRDFYPEKFVSRTIRAWDNYFWWLELHDLPSRSIVVGQSWPPPRGTLAVKTEAAINRNSNGVLVTTGAGSVTVWLSPEIINFNQPATIHVKGTRLRGSNALIEPSLGVMLEDARTRADRQHPFWAKVEMPAGVINQLD